MSIYTSYDANPRDEDSRLFEEVSVDGDVHWKKIQDRLIDEKNGKE